MNNNTSNNHSLIPHSWFKRLSQLLLREPQDRQQLMALLRSAASRELLDAQALAMIEGVLQVSNMQVRDIMIPRSQMVVVERDATPKEFLPIIIESAHSRFPVIGDTRDEVIGILLAKDLLGHNLNAMDQPFDISKLIRLPIFIPESKRLNTLLQEFRINHNHMAIVVDEYGGVAGLVTIEDVLEQIVGEIEDEYDVDEDVFIKQHTETQFIVNALTPIEEINEHFHDTLSDEEFSTIGGLVTQAFGHLPKRGESIIMDRYRIKVLQADNRRIKLLRFTLRKKIHSDVSPTVGEESNTGT
jgi:magnesium and cobalt transporter